MERAIYNYMVDYHVGKNRMIKNKELRKKFGIKDDRTLREKMQNIRESEDYPLVIGSKSGKNGGFYICSTEAEIQETIDNIKHRAKQMLKMCDTLKWKRKIMK